MKRMRLSWGAQDKPLAIRGTPGSLVEAASLFAYAIVWSLAMVAYIGVFLLTGMFILLLVLIWFPCFLWSKVSPKGKPQGRGTKSRSIG
jgi:hypothetical protein